MNIRAQIKFRTPIGITLIRRRCRRGSPQFLTLAGRIQEHQAGRLLRRTKMFRQIKINRSGTTTSTIETCLPGPADMNYSREAFTKILHKGIKSTIPFLPKTGVRRRLRCGKINTNQAQFKARPNSTVSKRIRTISRLRRRSIITIVIRIKITDIDLCGPDSMPVPKSGSAFCFRNFPIQATCACGHNAATI